MTSNEPGGSDLDRAEQQAPAFPSEQTATDPDNALQMEADPADVRDQAEVVELDEEEAGR